MRTMKKVFLSCTVAVCAFLSQSALAGDYLGFNLCKAADEEMVKTIVEDSGGTWEGSGVAKEYPNSP